MCAARLRVPTPSLGVGGKEQSDDNKYCATALAVGDAGHCCPPYRVWAKQLRTHLQLATHSTAALPMCW